MIRVFPIRIYFSPETLTWSSPRGRPFGSSAADGADVVQISSWIRDRAADAEELLYLLHCWAPEAPVGRRSGGPGEPRLRVDPL